jgi:serine O-acetyltransferase
VTDQTSSPSRRDSTARQIALGAQMLWRAPLLVGLVCAQRARATIDADRRRWISIVTPLPSPLHSTAPNVELLALLARYPEFRTLYYYRLRRAGLAGTLVAAMLAVVHPGERTLHLVSTSIGSGLFIQHGFATIVAARSVGANCWINQQVTIGYTQADDRPTIGDGVSVGAGAKVLGDITIGDRARIGANAVVLRDVPADHTAVGVPATSRPSRRAEPTEA